MLETCPTCGQPFMVPTGLLDLLDEGLYLLALHCRNCDRLALAAHDDAEVEAYERRLRATTADLEAYAEVLEVSRFIDEVDGFTRALQEGAVLPEDFGRSSP